MLENNNENRNLSDVFKELQDMQNNNSDYRPRVKKADKKFLYYDYICQLYMI